MKSLGALLLAATPYLGLGLAQEETPILTDSETGIVFNVWPTPQELVTFGMALPADALTTDASEFIGILTCKGAGWCGLSLGGSMTNNLLLLVYPQGDKILTSFRWATGYSPPAVYAGEARVSQIRATVNETHHELLFHCENCLQWDHRGLKGGATTSAGFAVIGWCHNGDAPTEPACADEAKVRQHAAQGIFGAQFNDAVADEQYEVWKDLAGPQYKGTCAGEDESEPPAASTTTPPRSSTTTKAPAYTTETPAPAPTPTQEVPDGVPGCIQTYTVESGNFCYAIAADFDISLEQLLEYNPNVNCDLLQVGSEVCVKVG